MARIDSYRRKTVETQDKGRFRPSPPLGPSSETDPAPKLPLCLCEDCRTECGHESGRTPLPRWLPDVSPEKLLTCPVGITWVAANWWPSLFPGLAC